MICIDTIYSKFYIFKIKILNFNNIVQMEDQNLYDEFGNYIGPELDSEVFSFLKEGG